MTTSPAVARLALAAALALAVALAACNRDREPAETPPTPAPEAGAEVTPAEAGAPMSYDSKNQYADVMLTLPDVIRSQPDLHAQIYAASVEDLRRFTEGAQADRTEAGGDEGRPPYERKIVYAAGAETGKLLSLSQEAMEYAGGAHPNTTFGAVLWDKAMKRQVPLRSLFRPGADMSGLDQALCAAVNAAKKARVPDAEPVTLDGEMWSCPRAATTPFILALSSTPGKAGGLTFLIGAYQVGPYVEGAYEVTVPLSAFRALLAPAYADEFAGQPA